MSEMTRKINPDNPPGPRPLYGESLSRTTIVKWTEEQFSELDNYCKKHNIPKTEFIRGLVGGALNKEVA